MSDYYDRVGHAAESMARRLQGPNRAWCSGTHTTMVVALSPELGWANARVFADEVARVWRQPNGHRRGVVTREIAKWWRARVEYAECRELVG